MKKAGQEWEKKSKQPNQLKKKQTKPLDNNN
jgi:hypothetical protein